MDVESEDVRLAIYNRNEYSESRIDGAIKFDFIFKTGIKVTVDGLCLEIVLAAIKGNDFKLLADFFNNFPREKLLETYTALIIALHVSCIFEVISAKNETKNKIEKSLGNAINLVKASFINNVSETKLNNFLHLVNNFKIIISEELRVNSIVEDKCYLSLLPRTEKLFKKVLGTNQDPKYRSISSAEQEVIITALICRVTQTINGILDLKIKYI